MGTSEGPGDQSMTPSVQVLLMAVLLVCSAFVSGSETALFALSRQQLRGFERSEQRLKQIVVHLMRQPRKVLTSVLIANTTVNICFFAVSFFLFENISRTHALLAGLGGLLVPFALIVLGEVCPKAIALSHCQRIAPLVAPLIETLALVLSPLRWVVDRGVVLPLTRIILPGHGEPPHVSTEELRTLVEMSTRQGVINVRENSILQQVVALPEVSVRAIMVPRVDIIAVSLDASREEICCRFADSGKKKLPVYGNDLDDIRGVISAVELHTNPQKTIEELTRPVRFVPEQANLLQLVQHFRRTKTQRAIVVDEYGGTAGLVSLEDVLEEIVGDIGDADETPSEPTVEPIDERTYRLSGDIAVRSLAEYFGVRPGAQGVETLGGFMLSQLGRLPEPGDVVRTANLRLTVEKVAARRVGLVRVELVDATGETEAQEETP